ncbi:ABC transporter ATP-binding protein [Candidatus Kaiserbacteria bacterium]|nr:ABC transporter ATP-binding protein [Candidatus Kaiserbacteria bacterium]
MKPTPLIRIEHCNLTFPLQFKSGKLPVLKNITIDIIDGEFLVLLGPSGSGKSTFLRVMSGLETGHTGTVALAPGLSKRDMSFVFQQFALFPWLTVYENIALGLTARGESPEMIRKKVARAAADLGLKAFVSSYPRELSGGMKQRVGIARALVTEPKIIFMDEPFSGLDSFTAATLRHDLLRIWKEKGMTIVLVTHLVAEALELADRIAVVTPRPASIETVVTNPLPRPRQTRTEEFFKLEDKITKIVQP